MTVVRLCSCLICSRPWIRSKLQFKLCIGQCSQHPQEAPTLLQSTPTDYRRRGTASRRNTMKGALRFLRTDTKQVKRRANTKRQRAYRQKLAKTKRVMLQSGQARQRAGLRQHRPCCGRHAQNCTCKAPKGMNKKPLTALAKRFTETDLCTVSDTTDVGPWQEIMQDRCKTLPMRVILGYSQIHVTFNQEHLLKQFVEDKAFLFKKPQILLCY